MTTTTEKPPTEPSKPEGHEQWKGAFGFFRRYQKIILYTAGIFALITFSITGAMQSWMKDLTGGAEGPQPTILVNGATVELQSEDFVIGGELARKRAALPPTVLPQFLADGDGADLATRFAILRRASLAEGLGVSMTEVDAAIDWMVRVSNERTKSGETPTQAALQRGMHSLAEYRTLVKEGMRIGNYALLGSLGIDTADAAVMQKLLDRDDAQKLTVRVATFDMQALERQLDQKGDVTEAMIKEWMEKKTDDEKTRLEVFDSNRVKLVLGLVRFKDFDAAQWPDELGGFVFGDEQQKRLYKEESDRWKGADGKTKPADDATVVDELKKLAQVDEVLNKLLTKIREAQQQDLQPLVEEQNRCVTAKADAQTLRDEAKTQSVAKPDDEALKESLRKADETLVAMETALTNATEAIKQKRTAFDFRAKFGELTKDKKGFEVRQVPANAEDAPQNAKALKDLAAVELGEWKMPELATSLQQAGDLGGRPARARDGAFLLQAMHVDVRPMKAWDELRPHLQAKYFEEKAKQQGDEKKKALEDALLRLAKEKLPEKMAAIDQRRQPEIDRRLGEWEKKLQDELAKATEVLSKLKAGSQAQKAWQSKKDAVEKELTGRDQKRTTIETEVKTELETEAKKEARTKYAEVLEAAAAETGFTVATLQPYRRDLRSQPLFDKRYERSVVFLWGGFANDLDAGECSEIVEDTKDRRWQMAACDKVEPLVAADVSRREFEMQKRMFGMLQVMEAMQQSFTLEALKSRYSYHEPVGTPGGD